MEEPVPFVMTGTYVESTGPGGKRVTREGRIELTRRPVTDEEKLTFRKTMEKKMALRKDYVRISSHYIVSSDGLVLTAKIVDELAFWKE